jgi:UBX domain-containing protein 1
MNSASSGAPSRSAPAGNDEDEDEDEDEDGRGESWFAGGERRSYFLPHTYITQCSFHPSGISIENPDRQRAIPGGDTVRDLLRRAAE